MDQVDTPTRSSSSHSLHIIHNAPQTHNQEHIFIDSPNHHPSYLTVQRNVAGRRSERRNSDTKVLQAQGRIRFNYSEPESDEIKRDAGSSDFNLRRSPSNDTYRAEAYILLGMSWPIALSYLLETSFDLVTFSFAGMMGPHDLAAASLGYIFCNVTGLSLGFGMASALDTLAPQAFGSSSSTSASIITTVPSHLEQTHSLPDLESHRPKNPHPTRCLDIVLQRGIIITLLTSIPLTLIWLNASTLLTLAGQDPILASRADKFVKYMIPGLPYVLVFECLKKYLLAMGDTKATMFILPAAIAVNVGVNMIFTFGGESGGGPEEEFVEEEVMEEWGMRRGNGSWAENYLERRGFGVVYADHHRTEYRSSGTTMGEHIVIRKRDSYIMDQVPPLPDLFSDVAASATGVAERHDDRYVGTAISLSVTYASMFVFGVIYVLSKQIRDRKRSKQKSRKKLVDDAEGPLMKDEEVEGELDSNSRTCGVSQVIGWWSTESLTNWTPFLMLGIPGMFATATEWWAIEICSLNAGLLSETSLAAQTIVQTGIHMWISTYYGVSVAASNRIGVFLGARDPARAKTTAVTAFLLSLAITLLNSSLVLIFLYLYSPFLASDIHPTPHPISPPDPSARVTTLVATLIPFAAVFHIFDGIATTAGAILRGCGRHRLAAGANLVAYYVVGIPVGLGLAFAGGWDVVGLWVGLGMGVGVAAVWMGRYVYGMDWEAEVEKVAAGTAVVGFGHG